MYAVLKAKNLDFKEKTMNVTVTEFKPRPARRQLSESELRAHFERVADQNDWKKPINRLVLVQNQEEIEEICEAIVYFTGSGAHHNVVSKSDKGLKVRFQALGYYAVIGG